MNILGERWPPKLALDELSRFGATGVSRSKGVVVFSDDALAEGIYIRDVNSVIPTNDTVGVGPSVLVLVFGEGFAEGRLVALDLIDKGVGLVDDFVAADVFRFEQGDIRIVVAPPVVIWASGESVCADHGGSRFMDESEIELREF